MKEKEHCYQGHVLFLPKVYELYNFGTKNKPKFKRNWIERKEVLYSSIFTIAEEESIEVDEEGDIVFLL